MPFKWWSKRHFWRNQDTRHWTLSAWRACGVWFWWLLLSCLFSTSFLALTMARTRTRSTPLCRSVTLRHCWSSMLGTCCQLPFTTSSASVSPRNWPQFTAHLLTVRATFVKTWRLGSGSCMFFSKPTFTPIHIHILIIISQLAVLSSCGA